MEYYFQSSLKNIFVQHGKRRHIPAGSFMLEKGCPAREVWYIVKGTVRSFCNSSDGDDITLCYISENNMVYSEALIPGALAMQDAQAITPLDVYTLLADEFLSLWSQYGLPTSLLFVQFVDRITLLYEYILISHALSRTGKAYCIFPAFIS